MDSVALLLRVADQATSVVDNVSPDQLSNPTPCAEWTVRDLINHITGGATMFAMSAEQVTVSDELMGQLLGGDNLGDDYKGAWHTACARVTTAFAQPGVLDCTVKLPFGEMPASIGINIAIFDVTTHATDLARATGQTITDIELLETALEMGRQMVGPELRQPGFYDPEQTVPADAPAADRLLGFAGRSI